MRKFTPGKIATDIACDPEAGISFDSFEHETRLIASIAGAISAERNRCFGLTEKRWPEADDLLDAIKSGELP